MEPAKLTPPYWINMGALAITTLAGARLILSSKSWEFCRFAAIYRRLYPVFLGDGDMVDSAVSHCWILEACGRARAAHLRSTVLVACFSVRDVHCRNSDVCQCNWNAVSADRSACFCLHCAASLADHVRCDALEDRTSMFYIWTTKASLATRAHWLSLRQWSRAVSFVAMPNSVKGLYFLLSGRFGLVQD